ncbi:hypothetical protein KVR01_008678 [Diaporthe batatas]|uniref:uncharacterized protein n=1 Tax=Diaporthe batatas TaxID=748121 RepID=UPI001D045F78|nr:uncharacterized protein KVR01_008678 [Diaporthe batatas]KAG8161691.1 hypothetical protein KVR01_008678 [Diaporthe batatas]
MPNSQATGTFRDLFSQQIVRPSAGGQSLSRVSTATSTTRAINTPRSSETDSASPNDARLPMAPATSSGPLLVTSLSVSDWRPQYPRIGQFAMTPSEEVVAATPDGLVYFKRVQDHPSKPWSEPRPFALTAERLDASNVTGLALHQEDDRAGGELNVYCVATGKLHAFSRSKALGSTFAVDPRPPFAGSTVSGTPAVASVADSLGRKNFCVVVPCPAGGILYTSTFGSTVYDYFKDTPIWEPSNQQATPLGIVSAVSVASVTATKPASKFYHDEYTTHIVAVCIARSRLYSIDGLFEKPSSWPIKATWRDPKSIRIQHPGEVTGNPVLLAPRKTGFGARKYQLDLLVPSAEGGVFHFIRAATTPDEWHMVGRIKFPTGIPIATSLAFWGADSGHIFDYHHKLRAFIQCGSRLYLIQTSLGAQPWVGSELYPVNGPGPFLH